MSERPTPETCSVSFYSTDIADAVVHMEFAENLERQRNEARDQIKLMLAHDQRRLESDSIVGSCDCDTKTPELKYHKPGCKYRILTERDEAREQLAQAKELLREIRDNEVIAQDEADKFLRDHQPSQLAQLREDVKPLVDTAAALTDFVERAGYYVTALDSRKALQTFTTKYPQ